MIKKSNIINTLSTVIVFNLISKLLGFIRDYFTAIKFGTSIEADAFLIASNIPNIIFMIIGIAINTTFIPLYNEVKANKSKKKLRDYYNNITTILVILSLILTILCEVFAPTISKLMAPGFSGEKLQLTIRLTRISSSVIVLNTIIYIYISILQCEDNFKIPAMIGIPYNIILILYYIFFADKYGVTGISILISIGLIVQVVILLIGLKRKNYKYKFIFNLKDIYLKKMIKLVVPIAIGTGVQQLNGIFNGIYASSLGNGVVASINYALKLNMLVIDILIMSIVTIYYQKISKAASEYKYDEVVRYSNKSICDILILIIPVVVILLTLNKPIVSLLFERGKFTGEATYMTSTALFYYSIGIFAVGINYTLTRVCYSFNDTRTPLKNTITSVLVNISLGYLLKQYMGIRGIALASSIGTIISSIILYFNVNKKLKGCINKETIKEISKMILASIPMIFVIIIFKIILLNNTYNLIKQVFILSFICILSIAIYVVSGTIFKIKILQNVKVSLLGKK